MKKKKCKNRVPKKNLSPHRQNAFVDLPVGVVCGRGVCRLCGRRRSTRPRLWTLRVSLLFFFFSELVSKLFYFFLFLFFPAIRCEYVLYLSAMYVNVSLYLPPHLQCNILFPYPGTQDRRPGLLSRASSVPWPTTSPRNFLTSLPLKWLVMSRIRWVTDVTYLVVWWFVLKVMVVIVRKP